jgi:hypothetical protein
VEFLQDKGNGGDDGDGSEVAICFCSTLITNQSPFKKMTQASINISATELTVDHFRQSGQFCGFSGSLSSKSTMSAVSTAFRGSDKEAGVWSFSRLGVVAVSEMSPSCLMAMTISAVEAFYILTAAVGGG